MKRERSRDEGPWAKNEKPARKRAGGPSRIYFVTARSIGGLELSPVVNQIPSPPLRDISISLGFYNHALRVKVARRKRFRPIPCKRKFGAGRGRAAVIVD